MILFVTKHPASEQVRKKGSTSHCHVSRTNTYPTSNPQLATSHKQAKPTQNKKVLSNQRSTRKSTILFLLCLLTVPSPIHKSTNPQPLNLPSLHRTNHQFPPSPQNFLSPHPPKPVTQPRPPKEKKNKPLHFITLQWL